MSEFVFATIAVGTVGVGSKSARTESAAGTQYQDSAEVSGGSDR